MQVKCVYCKQLLDIQNALMIALLGYSHWECYEKERLKRLSSYE